jgi:hypothetical protein
MKNMLDFTKLVAVLKGGLFKSLGFKHIKLENFDGVQDRKVVDTLFAKMEDYFHVVKVGRHSVVELAKSYLKGYASTWWRMVRQEEANPMATQGNYSRNPLNWNSFQIIRTTCQGTNFVTL